MSGHIYTLYEKADPGYGWTLNDPIFEGPAPTLGACVPNIRASVKIGGWIFAVSGRIPNERQFVIGGFRVAEKIDQLAAFSRFPEYRLSKSESSQLVGNVIVTDSGDQHPLDTHQNFQRRLENYLVGDESIFLNDAKEFERARAETLDVLSKLTGKSGNRVFDLIGRHRKLDDKQTAIIRDWLLDIKASH